MAGTIVYVDDESDLPTGLASELGRLGFRLHCTTRAQEAIDLVYEGGACLVLVEPLMAGGYGWSLVEGIRRLEGPAGDTPIVVLTRGERSPDLYGRAVELGADDFLARPVLRAEVLAAVLECLEAMPPVEPGAEDAVAPGAADASGRLEEVPLAELVISLREQAATGVLSLQDFEGLSVQLRNGSPIGVAASRGDESFPDFLMRTKRITDTEHEQLLARMRARGEGAPEAAAAVGLMTPGEVHVALEDRVAEPLLDAFAWSSGSWRFERGRRIGEGRALDRGVTRVLMEAALRYMPARGIRAQLDARGGHYLSRVELPPCAPEALEDPPCDPALVHSWVGDQTVAQVLESAVIGERELYALLVAGLVEVRQQALLELSAVVEEGPRPDEEDEVLDLDDVIEEPADDDAPAAEQTDPDAEELGEPETPADSEGAGRGRRAEHHFAEGDRHLAARRYDEAVQEFGMAAHLDPDEGDYRAHLGYAMHLQNPEDDTVRREALEHIARGIKLAPERWRPLLYLGRVFAAAGEYANARKVLVNAVRRFPDCQPLARELRILSQRAKLSQKPKGFLARLKRLFGR